MKTKKEEKGYTVLELIIASFIAITLLSLFVNLIQEQINYWNERKQIVKGGMLLNALEIYWSQHRDLNITSEELIDGHYLANNFPLNNLDWNVTVSNFGINGTMPKDCLYAPVIFTVKVHEPLGQRFSGIFAGPGIDWDSTTSTYLIKKAETQSIHSDYAPKSMEAGCLHDYTN